MGLVDQSRGNAHMMIWFVMTITGLLGLAMGRKQQIQPNNLKLFQLVIA
jgi:hypothetical protein